MNSEYQIELGIIKTQQIKNNKTCQTQMESRLTSNPNKSQIRTISQSRIIERKQIEKRLQNLSSKQLQKINQNLLKQNQKLKQQVTTFNEKVQKLLQSKKYQTQIKPNPHIQSQVLQIKKQLQVNYQTMKDLKQQVLNEKSRNLIEQTSNNYKQKHNHIRSMEIDLEQLNKQKDRLTLSIKDNQIDFQQYLPTRDLTAQLQVFKEDNKQLKKKIYNISINIKDNQRTAKQALTKIYTLKKQDSFFANNKMNRIRSLSVLSHHQPAKNSLELNQLKTLQHEIEELKKKKGDVESELSFEKMTKYTAKQKKEKEITELLQYHKRLFKRRVRQLTELNYLQKKQSNMRLQKQLQLQKANIPTSQRAMQTQLIIKKQYRKDWIGKSQGIPFDDSQHLQFKQSCQIKSLLIYRATDRIVFIRFTYQHPQTKYKYETKVPFDKEGLKKIQSKKINSKNNGFLVSLVLSVTKNIITRVQSIWSDGDSNVQGWENDQSSKYRLDIGDKERPISFYGTVVPHPKGFFALESLGCQILEQQD